MTQPLDRSRPPDTALAAMPTRRSVALGLIGAATAGALAGCAGPARQAEPQPMADAPARPVPPFNESQALAFDSQLAPQQFSLDLGAVPDAALQAYLDQVALGLQAQLGRRALPYSQRVLNAHHLNAYAFPAGTLGLTRGLLVMLQDEAELAAVLALQLAHVEARHTAASQRTDWVEQAIVTQTVVASQESAWMPALGLGGQIGASALLPAYSAAQVAEADTLALRTLAAAGYPAQALPAVMGRVLEAQAQRPGIATAWLATQPLDAARRERVQREADGQHAASRTRDPRREPFTTRTAGVGRLRPLIEACKDGEAALARKAWPQAQRQFRSALDMLGQDYAANLRMAQTLHLMGRLREARGHAVAARDAYPQEAQAHKLAAALALAQRDPAAAWQDLDAHDRLLAGDPGVVFLKAVALEALGQSKRAAEHYEAYLGYTARGQAAQYALTRLRLLGYGR